MAGDINYVKLAAAIGAGILGARWADRLHAWLMLQGEGVALTFWIVVLSAVLLGLVASRGAGRPVEEATETRD